MKYFVILQQVPTVLKIPTFFLLVFYIFVNYKGEITFKKILLKTQIVVAIMNINKTN